MTRLFPTLAAAILALGLGSGAMAQETSTASTGGSAEVAEQGGIQTTGEVIFQNIVVTPTVNVSSVVSSEAANVVVSGAGGDAVSLAVPQTFKVISADTGETVTVVTTTSGDYAAIEGLQTLLSSGGSLSVDVGGAIHITADQLQPGEYQGLLVVVAQYN